MCFTSTKSATVIVASNAMCAMILHSWRAVCNYGYCSDHVCTVHSLITTTDMMYRSVRVSIFQTLTNACNLHWIYPQSDTNSSHCYKVFVDESLVYHVLSLPFQSFTVIRVPFVVHSDQYLGYYDFCFKKIPVLLIIFQPLLNG